MDKKTLADLIRWLLAIQRRRYRRCDGYVPVRVKDAPPELRKLVGG